MDDATNLSSACWVKVKQAEGGGGALRCNGPRAYRVYSRAGCHAAAHHPLGEEAQLGQLGGR